MDVAESLVIRRASNFRTALSDVKTPLVDLPAESECEEIGNVGKGN